MPGKLDPVSQSFSADTSGYIAGLEKAITANIAFIDSIDDVIRKSGELSAALKSIPDTKRIAVEVTGLDAAIGKVGELRSALDSLSDRNITVNVRHTGDAGTAAAAGGMGADPLVLRELRDSSASLDMVSSTMGRVEEHLAVMRRDMADASADLMTQTAMMRSGGGADPATLAAAALAMAAGGGGRRGRGGGGGGAAAAAMAAAAGGGGGGGGGAFAGAAAGGISGRIFGGALPTLQVAHLVTMFTMEVLSTVIPAAVAAGAAGLVGLQAGQNLYQRGSSMWTAAEALGGAYGGQTLGSMVGLSSNLQKAQDLAQGGVFGIGGALKDLVGQGGGAFTSQGVQTIAMINRGMAAMVMNNRMKQLTDAMSGGTGFLRMFGDIGANVGDTLLNLAPNLPGMGPMLFKGLEGITGAMSAVTGGVPGPLMGGLLAGEAGWRWGKLVLGGGKLPFFLGGGKVGGLAGLAERMGLGAVGAGGAAGTGAAGFLDAAGGPLTLAAALSAFTLSQLAGTMVTPAQRNIGAWQGAIGQSFGAGALTPITSALYKSAAGAAGSRDSALANAMQGTLPSEIMRFGPIGPGSEGQIYGRAVNSFASQLGDLVAAGPSAIRALQGIGIKGTTLTQAFEAMSMAMISPQDLKGGQLDARARQQLQQFSQTYRTASIGGQPGTASGLLTAGAADYIMSSPGVKAILQTNQALDSMTQIMTGGPAGQAALFGMLGGTPTYATRGGLQVAPPYASATRQFAQALTSPFTIQGSAAWTKFAGPQGMIAGQQANLDQARMYMTLGAISGQQGARLGAFDLQQMLPLAAKSPMAQYMLEQMGMQASIPGISVGMSYKNLVKAITGTAPSSAGALGILTQGTKAVADLPAIAASLITGDMGGPSALQSALTAQMAQQGLALAAHPLLGGGGVNMAALRGLTSSLTAGGVKPGQMTVAVDAILKNLHVPDNLVAKINAQINTAQAQSQLNALKGKQVNAKVNVAGSGELKTLEAEIAALKSKNVQAAAKVQGAGAVAALNAEIAALHSKEVTITTRMITVGGLAGVTPGIPVGVVNPNYNPAAGIPLSAHHAAGFLVPGYGGGDRHLALLEGGEAVVPKHLTGAVAPFLAAHRVPGFAGGGFVGQQVFGPMSYWSAGSQMAMWNPALYAQLLAAMRASRGQGVFAQPQGRWLMPMPGLGGPGGGGGNVTVHPSAPLHHAGSEFAVQILQGMKDGLKHAGPEARKLADALVSKLRQEMGYATGVANAAAYGQGYDPTGRGSGIFGSMQLNPSGLTAAQMHASPTGNIRDYNAYVAAYAADQVGANAPQSVQDQMKSYLATEKSFGADLGKLRRQHLNKAVLAQIIAAGPQQGDQIARSILGGQGGVGAANKLWAQIQKASKGIGAQAAMGEYGGHVDPNLKSATIVNNNVSVNVTAEGGNSLSNLTPAQINQLVGLIQQKLLQQAKRNKGTGIKPKGKSS